MTWAILTINNKGGTGKSTVAVETAKALRDEGYDVGLLDADIDSANLASRLGCDKMVEFKGDHIIEPVEHDGMLLYSMENAFQESTFSQSGKFFREVIDDMVNQSDWGMIDYMIVDCPPGSSDVFTELVRALRPSILGALSVGISDALDDTVRLAKVCNHNWVPIIGFIENMSGVVCHDNQITCDGGDGDVFEGGPHPIEPFGSGKIRDFCGKVEGNYIGSIPLCTGGTEIPDVASDTIDGIVKSVEQAEEPALPDDNLGDTSFIRNVWKTVKKGISRMNDELNIQEIRDEFGVENREPLVLSLEITDAGPISSIFNEIIMTVDGGEIEVMRPKSAKKKGLEVEAKMKITSQDLYDAVRGEKKVMRSVTGDVTTVDYSITQAVQMGDAEIEGDRTVNRLAVLDRILTDAIDVDELREQVL